MNPGDFDARELFRLRLEEQLRRDVEVLYQAAVIKMRAYDTVARAQGELAGEFLELAPPVLRALSGAPPGAAALPAPAVPDVQPPPAPPASARRPKVSRAPDHQLYDAVLAVLGQLGEVFDKNDLCRALGFQPRRSSLHDVLANLMWSGQLELEKRGHGRVPTRYRRRTAPQREAEPPAG